jgi:mono/diheme cytochrome c family protein
VTESVPGGTLPADPHARWGRLLTRRLPRAVSSGLAAAGVLTACTPGTPTSAPPPAVAGAPSASVAPAGPSADPYHPPPRDTVELPLYRAWQQFSLQCARCHGEDGQGTSFGPSLLHALGPDGDVNSHDAFVDVLTHGRPDKGMPSAAKMGLDSTYFDGLYAYLKARSDGRLHGGRPARREG